MPFEVVGLVVVGALVGLVGCIGGCVVVGKGEEAIAAVAVDTVAAVVDVVVEDRSDAVAAVGEFDEVEDVAAAESRVVVVAAVVGQGYEEELGQSV